MLIKGLVFDRDKGVLSVLRYLFYRYEFSVFDVVDLVYLPAVPVIEDRTRIYVRIDILRVYVIRLDGDIGNISAQNRNGTQKQT